MGHGGYAMVNNDSEGSVDSQGEQCSSMPVTIIAGSFHDINSRSQC